MTQRVWKHLRNDKGGLASIVKDLSEINAYHGLCWMINPHERNSYKTAIDFDSDQAIRLTHIPIWIYAVMPRGFALSKRLSGSRSKMGIKCYPPEKFVDNQT